MTGLSLPDGAGGGVVAEGKSAFGIAPGRFLVVDQNEGLGIMLKAAVLAATGTITDLSHGRTAIRISGPKSEWVLASSSQSTLRCRPFPKAPAARPPITTSSRRSSAPARSNSTSTSSARSRARFWTALCHASEEVGYEVR